MRTLFLHLVVIATCLMAMKPGLAQPVQVRIVSVADVPGKIPATARATLEARRQQIAAQRSALVTRISEFNRLPAQQQGQQQLDMLSREAAALSADIQNFNAQVQQAASSSR